MRDDDTKQFPLFPIDHSPLSNSEGIFYLLLTLKMEWYLRIKEGIKKYEFRRVFPNRPTTSFIYLRSPYKVVSGVIEFDTPIVESPEAISKIAESQRPGGGASIMAYMNGLTKGYAIPIRALTEIEPVSLQELRGRFPGFTPPQSYIILNRNPDLLAFLLDRRG